jgi:dolichyl-phosphate beta-glucosyltransferase
MNTSNYDAFQHWSKTPLATPPRISVVVPAYNEALRILPTIGAIATHMSSRSTEPWELIVADDGSSDNTVELLNNLGFVNMQVLVAKANGGKGSAVRRGVEASRGEYILFADADQSTPIEQFDMLLGRLVDGGYDIAVGSRADLSASETKKSVFRRIATTGLRLIVKLGFGIKIRDTQCGFKLFRADIARDLFSRQRIRGFSFDLELLYLAQKRGYRTLEIPVEWIDAPGSTLDVGKVSLSFLADLCKIRINHLRGLYAHVQNLNTPHVGVAEGQPS